MAPRDESPAERLLSALGPVTRFHDFDKLGDFGLPARQPLEALIEPGAMAGPDSRLGPLEAVHVFWFAGLSCDGCTVSVTGAQTPSIESLVMGAHPGLPRLVLHHPVVSLESGPAFLRAHELALQAKLDAPYVVVVEGSIGDELALVGSGGYWAGQGEEPWGPDGDMRTVTAEEWIARLTPGAAVAIAVGTCATWGGIPAAVDNPTGAMGLMDFLGAGYRSALGLPVVNIPGCAPVGDNVTETIAALLYFVQGIGPLPEFDELGRPAWLFGETVHNQCGRAASYADGTRAEEFGDPGCLVDAGCWGPVVTCNIASRGAINHAGGCMKAGGVCIGCTMPGFPDTFAPFAHRPALGAGGERRLPWRQRDLAGVDRAPQWEQAGSVPSGWARVRFDPKARRPRHSRPAKTR
ncbi:MAG: hydrogenase expression protein HypE [Acidimicrobiales bacterium]